MYGEPDYEPGENYEFMFTDPVLSRGERLSYRCFRGGCKGGIHLVSDRNTHNNYHNHVDNGLPSPYAMNDPYFDESLSMSDLEYRVYERAGMEVMEPKFKFNLNPA